MPLPRLARVDLYQLIGGLRAGMGYTGCGNDRRISARRRSSSASRRKGLRESHVHDVIITEEAPNYRSE